MYDVYYKVILVYLRVEHDDYILYQYIITLLIISDHCNDYRNFVLLFFFYFIFTGYIDITILYFSFINRVKDTNTAAIYAVN